MVLQIPIPTEPTIPAEVAFIFLASVTVIGAILALEAKELIYGAISLGLSFIGVAGLFVLLDAPYLAMLQIAVYVGAVVVLILFTIMLVRRERGEELKEEAVGLGRLGLWLGGIAAIAIGGVWLLVKAISTARAPAYTLTVAELGDVLTVQYGVALFILGLVITATLIGALTLAKREEAEE